MCIVGSKWTVLILRDLATGPKRFSELEKLVDGINPRTLSRRLEDLKQHDVLVKTTVEGATHATYGLTPKGQGLVPILRQMAAWGDKYHNSPRAREATSSENPALPN